MVPHWSNHMYFGEIPMPLGMPCRSQGTLCCSGHAILWYIKPLCAALYTPSVKLAMLSDPAESVMLHSLQCSPIVLDGEGGTVLNVGDWLLSVTEWEVIFPLRPIMVWVTMGKNQIPLEAEDEVREKPTSTAMIVGFLQKRSAMTCHVSCVVFWAHKIMSCMQSSSSPAHYWHFLKLINCESTDPWYSMWHPLFPL